MNLIPLSEIDIKQGLAFEDERAIHIKKILKEKNDFFKIGHMEQHSLGKGRFIPKKDRYIIEEVSLDKEVDKRKNSRLVIGALRPPTTKRLLKDLTSMGLREVLFFSSDLCEKSYLKANFWKEKEIQDILWLGAAQGKTTFLPSIKIVNSFFTLFHEPWNLEGEVGYLDFGSHPLLGKEKEVLPRSLIIGPERGFSPREQEKMKSASWEAFSLGDKTLRSETAAIISAFFLTNF